MLSQPLRVVAVFVLATPLFGQLAQLSAPAQALAPGQVAVASLSLATSGQAIAAIQFDLQWDLPLGLQITAGDQVRAVSKIPSAASPGSRTVRLLVAGMDQGTIADGELFKLFISADPAAAKGSAQVRVVNPIASDPFGGPVPINVEALNVQIAPAQNPGSVQFVPVSAVLNAASLMPGPLSPGEIITLFGFNGLPNVSVKVDGFPAPILYAGNSQINAIVPYGLDLTHTASLQLQTPAQSITLALPVAPTSPAIFTLSGTGLGSGAVLNEDYSVNSPANPARAGSTIMVYGTGFGGLLSPVTDGQAIAALNPTAGLVTATVAGLSANVVYAGAAPALVAGLTQVNVQLPAGLVHNLVAPLGLTISGSSTINGVVVAIQ
jgi:uncharacterized protein (TIGR03437 family)